MADVQPNGINSENGGSMPDITAALPSSDATGAADTAALQAAIDATPVGGRLMIPRGTYVTNAALTISRHISIVGQSLVTARKSVGAGGTPNGPSSPFLDGTIISQKTAATDVIQITDTVVCHMRDVGITFDAAILHTNTGHGINATAAIHNTGHDIGLSENEWHNVVVYGHDGNHYAFNLINPLLGTFVNLRSYGGGGLWIECDSHDTNLGNLVFIHPYIDVFNAGTAHGYALASRTAWGSANGVLNMLSFFRPQANITGAANAGGAQYLFKSNAGANLPAAVSLHDPDFEATSPLIDFGGVNSGTTVRGKGGLINGTPASGFDGDRGYQLFTAGGTFVVPVGVYKVHTRVVGGGGQGGGGGSNVGAAANAGGGGGAGGMVTEAEVDTTPGSSFTVTVGAGGTAAGGGGGSGGAVGTAGSNGAQSSFGGNIKAGGGAGGAGGPASATTSAGGGIFARSGGASTSQFIPGFGGPSVSPNGIDAIPMPPGVCGGGGGGAATTTKGGNGGGASTGGWPQYTAVGGGSGGGATGAAGNNGTTATTPGCGGGGGGGALTGGAGGNGGNGANGMVEAWW